MNYSDYCYTCIFDDDFNIVWTDNYSLFRRLARRHEKVKKLLFETKGGVGSTVYYTLKAEGESYSIKIDLLMDMRIICRASRDLPDNSIESDELKKDIEIIHNNSMNAVYMMRKLREFKPESDLADFQNALAAEMRVMSAVSAGCSSILQMFETESERYFVPLEKYLISIFDRINYSLRNIRKDIVHCIFVKEPYWKIDCKNFELMIFSIVKMMLMLTTFGNGGIIMVRTTAKSNLHISVEFPYQQNYSLRNCHAEMLALKHLFDLMDGELDFFQEGGSIVLEGYIKSEFTYRESEVKNSFHLCTESIDTLLSERMMNRDRHYELYSCNREEKRFESPVMELQSASFDPLEWWELVFEGVVGTEM